MILMIPCRAPWGLSRITIDRPGTERNRIMCGVPRKIPAWGLVVIDVEEVCPSRRHHFWGIPKVVIGPPNIYGIFSVIDVENEEKQEYFAVLFDPPFHFPHSTLVLGTFYTIYRDIFLNLMLLSMIKSGKVVEGYKNPGISTVLAFPHLFHKVEITHPLPRSVA